MLPVLEAVPNFSEGRDLDLVRELVAVIAREGADVLDWSADPDHHRSVVTFLGDPPTVEAAALAAATFAVQHIDLSAHSGVHPRIGALDVLPFIPLHGLDMDDAIRSARRIGRSISRLGVPVYWYGAASPTGARLADLRRGGFEVLRDGFPTGRESDLTTRTDRRPHPTAGVTCVGARAALLAWNVIVTGVTLAQLREVAGRLRETGGGFRSLRTLALQLPASGELQISMNLEDPVGVSPIDVFEAIEDEVEKRGGSITGTEVVGMIPDPLVLPGIADRLRLLNPHPGRALSARLGEHLDRRASSETGGRSGADPVEDVILPETIRGAAQQAAEVMRDLPTSTYAS